MRGLEAELLDGDLIRSVLDGFSDPAFLLDRDHRIRQVNAAWHRRFSGYRVEFTFPQIGRRVFLLNGQQLYDEGIGTDTILLAFLDVTERERIARQLRTMSSRLRSAREEEDKRVAHDLRWRWVEGHAGHAKNEYANDRAIRAAERQERSNGLVPSDFDSWLARERQAGRYRDYDPDRELHDSA